MKYFLLSLLVTSVPFSSASAELLAGYDFTYSINASQLAPGVTASPITGGGDLKNARFGDVGDTQGISASGLRFGSTSQRSIGKGNIARKLTNFKEAIRNNSYLTFTVTADVPETLQISKLSFHTAIGGGAAPSRYNVLARANGSENWIWRVAHALTTDQHTQVNQMETKWHPTSIDMSQYDFFQNVNSVEFRIYFWGGKEGAIGSRVNIDNIVVEGSTAQPKSFSSSSPRSNSGAGLIGIGDTTLILK